MKLATYNIYEGGYAGIDRIMAVVKEEAPDILTLNEANSFSHENNKLLYEFAHECGYPYYDLAISGQEDYHVALLSKYPWESIQHITPLTRACIIAIFNTNIGQLAVCGLHLSPHQEYTRLPEIEHILTAASLYENRILMGDFNSLSPNDDYTENFIRAFNEKQIRKFTENGKLEHRVISHIGERGYRDCGHEFHCEKVYTAPTKVTIDSAHSNMRLDYIFVSESIMPHINDYRVIKNEVTDHASDHCPVCIKIEGVNSVKKDSHNGRI